MKQVILIADDDEAVRTTVGRFLASENYDVVFAKNGTQALSEFLIVPFDLLLLDLMMPNKGGWEVFDTLSKSHPMMPIILMTGLPNQQEHAKRVRADALPEKPLDLPLLLNTVRRVLGRRHPVRATAQVLPSEAGDPKSLVPEIP